ncbi:MAG TPA: hypothetical protein PKY87_04005 [Terricaulis sp.]|nr:hypothetical protein [Terricaulis sp.]
MQWSLRKVEAVLAGSVLALGLVVGFGLLDRGLWLDEFWTLTSARPEQSWAQFWALMANEVHPPLHYLLIQAAQKLGVTDVAALRALNLLGVPLVLFALWQASRRRALDGGQVCAVLAIYAASPMFLETFADMRAYFLVYSASIATTLSARTLLQAEAGARWDWSVLLLWGVSLAVLVNLHYFAVFMGGLLTFAIVLLRGGRGVMVFLCVSALAAAPAVSLFLVQRLGGSPDITSWIATGRIDAVLVMLDQIWAAGAGNVVAFGVAATALLIALERGALWPQLRDPLAFIAVLAVFFAFLTLANAVRPIVIDRYLIACGGCVVVALALLAAGPQAPRLAVAAICVFALLSQARALYTGAYERKGWTTSAEAVAAMVEACPATQVFTMPSLYVGQQDMLAQTRRYGFDFYAGRYGLEPREVARGDVLPAPSVCPNIVWFEHIWDPVPPLEDLRAAAGLSFSGRVDMLRIGTGVLLVDSAQGAEAPPAQ